MNGLVRKSGSYSTCPVTLYGNQGTVITNGVVEDINGNLWNLPSPVTIPSTGNITVTATCQTIGSISANPGDISIIATPTAGWLSCYNHTGTTQSSIGQPMETDSQLRARQTLSVALPSMTATSSTIAAIAAVPGVTRYNPGTPTPGGQGSSVENPTGAVDVWGNPPHSISMVVEGGADADVAMAIYQKRSIGCFTNGTTTVAVTDPNTGNQMNISFFRPTYVPIYVELNVHALQGFTSTTQASIQTAIVNYLNGLAIGEEVTVSALYGAALSVMPNLARPQFSIQALSAGAAVAQTTASTTSGSNQIIVASATGIANGQVIAGNGIPSGTKVTGVSDTTITLSQNATATASGVAVQFFSPGTSDISILFNQVAQGANVVVNLV
jgi:uncharacterized phage protein gp47/JayE